MEVRWKIILILAHVFILSQLLLPRASTVSSSKTIHLPPGTADELHVGCLQQQKNYSRFIHRSINATSPYKCAHACAQKELPLAATFNDTECHCANEALIAYVNNESCAGLSGESTLQVYNTSFFMVAFAELYQELMFTVFPPKITEVNSTAGNLSSYSLDFGDRRANSALHDKIIHRYASTGEFNVTLFASQANSTKLISFRSVKVFAPLRVNNMTCPASSPGQNVLCTLYGTSGSGVTLRVEMESADQNATLTVPDSPRVVLGNDEFLPFKESNAGEVGAGTYLLQSREFWADTFLEAWELYAVQSGRIRLQVYRAQWNQTICHTTTHLLSSCQDMAPSNGSCNRVCFSVEYDKQSQPISSCAPMLANYSIVHTLDVNLTVGYNLIVVPEEQRLTSKIGDIVAFQRNSSGAVLQRITDGQSPGVYYYSQEQPSSTPSVFLNDLKALNFSFRLYVHGSVTATALLNVSCMHDVGIYHLKAVFTNPSSSNDNRKPVEIQSNIIVQNPIMDVPETIRIFIAVNVSKNLTLTIRQGTNITCEWKMPASSFLKRQSHYIEKNTTTEGVTCQMEFSELPRAAISSITITFYAFNLISKTSKIIEICVREVIKGLKVEMCRLNSFAYDNAHTCFNASVVKGTDITCKWYFKKGLGMDHIRTNRINERINHALTPVGETNVTVHCYNRLPEDERVIFPVRIIPNPLSIDMPVKVAVGAKVKINCQITWPNGTPDKFFEIQGLTGQKGTDIAELPRLTVSVYSSSRSGNGSVTLETTFWGLRRKHQIKCKADQFPELNLVQTITSLFPVRGVNISTQCPFRFAVGTSCTFQVSIRTGDHASFLWRVTENGSHPLEFTKRTIIHQFSSLGKASVSINVSNDVSWRTKTIYFIAVHSVSILRSAELRHATSGFIGQKIIFSVARLYQPSLCRFFWNWDDTSPSEEAGPYTTHTYFKQGQYNVSVNISTGINNILLFSAVTVHGPINILTQCPFRFAVGTSCTFQVSIRAGDHASFLWRVTENGSHPLEFTKRTIIHQFSSLGKASVSINVSNDVSWRTKTIYFIAVHSVSFLRSAELRHATSGFIGQKIIFSVARLYQPSLCRFFWNWDDTSPSEEAGPYTTHTYFKQGQYNVSVNISTGINNILLFSAVTVHGPINILTQCPFRFAVGTSCTFQVSIRAGDHASFLWRVTENGSHPLEFTKHTIIHRFSSLGQASVSINVSNDVSWRTKTIYFIAVHSVFFLRSAELRHATSGFIGHTIAFSVARLDQPSLCRFFWNWDDKSPSKEAGPYTAHTYFKPGRYNVSVNISTGINNMLLFSVVTVHGPIKGLQIRDIELGSSKVLTVRFEILQGHNVTYTVDFGDISETTTGFASQLPHLKTFTHQYKKPGTYLLSISVNNVVGPNSSVQRSVQITESPCIINELRVIGAGEDSDHPPEIQQEYEYSLYSSLKINCSSAQNLNYEWKVEHVLSYSEIVIVPFPKEQVSSDSLSIAAQSLTGGLYKFTLTFTATPLGISRSSIGFLRVLVPKLLATIDCGSERVMPWNKEIVLNGSGSRDPNDVNSSSTNSFLSFEWFCNFHRNVSCFKGDINNTQPVLRFPSRFLDSNTTYQFVLLVTKESREAEASQIITVRDGNFVPLCIRCMENCALKLTASQELVLRSEGCLNKNETVRTCRWELHGPPPHRKRRSVNSQLISFAYSSLFKVYPSTLDSNQRYTIIFKDENSSLSSRYSILTDMPPEGGSCSVSPLEGIVIETQFRINCRGWEDEDSPLLYEFFLGDPTSEPMLLFYSWLPYSDGLFLPPGRKDKDYYVELFVNIRDVLGSYKRVTLEVKVKNFSPTAGPVSSILKGMVSGPNSMLDQLLVSGEFRQATQFLNTVITVLNQDSSPVTTTDSADTENRIEVRGRVIQDLSRMCCSSHRGIRQALVGLLQATRVTTELSPNALENGANGLSKMAETLVGKFRWVRADNTTRDILNGLSHVIEGSVTTSNQAKLEQGSSEIKDWVDDKNEARNKDQLAKSEKATNKSLEGIDYAAHKLLNYKLRGDSPSHVTSGLMTLTVTRQSPRDITSAALNGGKVNFQIPSEVKNVKLGQVAVVNTKVVTMLQNPFISSSAVPMDAPVSSLELLETTGKKIDIQNLTEPVSVFLRVNQSKNSDLDIITDVISLYNEIMFYKFEAGNENSLYFRINCSGILRPEEMLLVMGKRNSKPSNENFDVSWSLPSCNGTITKLLTRKYLNNSAGFYLGLKLLQEGNTTNGSTAASTIKFNVVVKFIGCYYWNENQQAWKTDGCEVGTQTTLDSIHCECTHLTWFGSRVFVPPNKLNLDKIKVLIVDPSNYVPIITVLSITCGLYLLALIWARREDRKDMQKIGASLSPSNKLGDTHAYEVIISTGMRRHAGTTANVAMTMTGERGESHAFLLKNSHCATLARGSVNTVLVSTSETLGELSYIRVWHDNFGDDPAWYLKQLCIREIATDRVWHFVCERWLAIDEGDGLIDRILTVTSDKEMKEFRRLFLTKTYKDLTDSHLWFSVFWRPPQSPFTRVQRVSCCFSLLLCTMMANAMWYEADKGRYTAVQLGSLEFSWEQVFIGVCSSLIVFPVNLILVQIFRHCGRRPARKLFCKSRSRASSTRTVISRVQSASGESSCHGPGRSVNRYQQLNYVSPSVSPTYSSPSTSELRLMSAKRLAHLPALFPPLIGAPNFTDSSSDVRNLLQSDSGACSPTETAATSHEEAPSKGKQLPWWFVYVGWVLVIITSLVAGSVTLLYGIQFGLQKSTQWLLSMFFSVTQDIFVSQPLKVVGLAVFFALIFKKTNKVKLSPSSVEHYSHHQLEPAGSNLKEEHAVAPTVNVPPENILQLARGKAAKERAMHAILLDFGTFILFTLFVLLIAYGIRDQDSFHQNNAVVKVALSHSFNRQSEGFRPHIFTEIIRPRDLWDWTEKMLLPTLYNVPYYLYTGKAPKFMEGETGLVVGVARLRQHRARKDSCSVAPMVRDIFSRCVEEYDSTTEDNQAYNEGWELGLNNTGPQKLSSALSPWRYSSANELKGYPYKGKVTTYSGGGYVLELSHIYYKALRQIKSARSSLWLDRYTRSVFVEFSLYNPNSNLFCAVTFLLERPATGGLIPRVDVVAYRLYRYVGDFQLFILACEVLFVVFVLYFTYREAKKIYKTRRVYLTEGTNLLELVMLILCWIAIGYYFVWLGLRKWTLNLYHKNPTKFISFQYLSAWELLFEGVVGVTVFVTCLKFIKLFRFNRRIFLLSWTLRQASAELLPYLIVFMINFLAFALIYHVLLVGEYDSFSTLIGSMQKLLSALLGKFNVAEMISAYRVVTAGIFILYMIITNFLLLNVLIVIIIESFSVVKQKNDEMENEFELLEYVMGRVGEVLGIRTLNKTVDQEPFAYSNKGIENEESSSPRRNTRKVERVNIAKRLEQALDKLDAQLDRMQDTTNDDDMLCLYVSRRYTDTISCNDSLTVNRSGFGC